MKLANHTKGYIMVTSASILWGTVGLFAKFLFQQGIPSQVAVFWRVAVSFLALFLYLYIKNKDLLKIDKKGLLYAALMGLICQTLFHSFYLGTIERTSVATAVILLYTSPAFITIMARIFYKEAFTFAKIISLFLSILGCFLAATGASLAVLKLNGLGVFMGLGAGFTYAMLTILSKFMLKEYNSWTLTVYSFAFGVLFLFPFSQPFMIFQFPFSWITIISISAIALLATALAFGLYITGLSYGIDSSKAGIICTLEVVVSLSIAYLVFSEALQGWKLVGVLMVLLSVLTVQSGELFWRKLQKQTKESI